MDDHTDLRTDTRHPPWPSWRKPHVSRAAPCPTGVGVVLPTLVVLAYERLGGIPAVAWTDTVRGLMRWWV